ncbi:MAG: DUF1592 domain-containing protein [Opitutaceae bacterium]
MAPRNWRETRRFHLQEKFHAWRIAVVMVAAATLPVFASAADTPADPKLAVFRRDIQPILERYCYDCHGDGAEKGGVKLDGFNTAADLGDHGLWLRALRNVRSGIMPPVDEEKPSGAEAEKLMQWIKREGLGLDPNRPDPGRVTVRRLNRVEYRNTIRDLLGIEFDTQKEFPADDTGHGFDNIADVLTISPLLMEKYLDTAQTVIAKAVVTKPRTIVETSLYGRQFSTVRADTKIPEAPKPPEVIPADAPASVPIPATSVPTAPGPAVAVVPPAAAPTPAADAPPSVAAAQPPPPPPAGRGRGQLPGGRGGGRRGGPPPVTRPAPTVENDTLVMSYYTPAVVAAKHRVENAGKYQLVFDLLAQETYADDLFDLNKCKVILTLDGQKLLEQEFVREGYGKKFEYTFDRELTAGEHELSMEIQPVGPETPQYRKLRMRINAVTVRGPLEPKHWVSTPGYEKFFPREIPVDVKGRRLYAQEILEKFATRAFRRPVDTVTLERLVGLAEKVYSQPTSTFETGVAQAMVAALASPTFIFREDRTEPVKTAQTHPLVDEYSLASRLSYFFWSSMPDDELFKLAATGTLRANLAAQVPRMLADPRAQELVKNFTGQWLQARDIATVPINALDVYLRDNPNPAYEEARDTLARLQAIPREQRSAEDNAASNTARTIVMEFTRSPKPDLTDALRRAMLQETEMSFGYLLKEDRSMLELLKSDYAFLNEALANFYGIEGVKGSEMRKVMLPENSPRGGVLTQGTILAVTSNPTRTSPVKRGVFILDAILGTPPAPPPPNIPSLEAAASAAELKTMSLRDTLALHAKNPTCASCHSRMDPLGLALENFNAMGAWRTTEVNQPVQPAGKLITGESFADIRGLKDVLVTSHRRDFYYCISEKLLTYALGRGLQYYDEVTLDQLVAQLEASGGRSSVLLQGIVNSAPFQQRRQTTPSLAGETPSPTQVPERLSQTKF